MGIDEDKTDDDDGIKEGMTPAQKTMRLLGVTESMIKQARYSRSMFNLKI